MSGLSRTALQYIARHYPVDILGRIENTVLISGVGRSGTTWLDDFVNFDNRYRDLFEPFHAWVIPKAEVLKGQWYQRPGDEPPAPFVNYVERVLSGRARHTWVDRFNKRVISSRRIVKAIRADLFLGWLATRYPELKIIHLVRHPAAVAQSRLRLPEGWEWRPTLAEMLEQERLRDSLSEAQILLCQAVKTRFQEYILTWCISTRAASSSLQADRGVTVRYEGLLTSPEAELRPVFEYLERPWDPRCLDVHGIPSHTARNRGEYATPSPRETAPWITRLEAGEKNGSTQLWMRSTLGTCLGKMGIHPLASPDQLPSLVGCDLVGSLARTDVFDYIEMFYNRSWRHSH